MDTPSCPETTLQNRDPALILAHQIESQKLFRQWHMCLMQNCLRCHHHLMAALGALIPSISQQTFLTAATFRTKIPASPPPPLICQVLLVYLFRRKAAQLNAGIETIVTIIDNAKSYLHTRDILSTSN